MKNRTGFILIGLVSLLTAQNLTLEDIYLNDLYTIDGIDKIRWLEDERGFLFVFDDSTEKDIHRYQVDEKRASVYFRAEDFEFEDQQHDIDDFWINSDQSWLLLATNQKRKWRHSRWRDYYLVELATGRIKPLPAHDQRLLNAKFSPDGKLVAFVRANDLYVYNPNTGKETRLTKDGSDDIINGQFGWVYEEEFGSADGYRWSPDSRYIAFWREDQTDVKSFYLMDELDLYPHFKSFKYPKVGETNPTVKIGVVDVRKTRIRWLDTDNGNDHYLPRICWSADPRKLAVIRMNRRQNRLEILAGDIKTGRTKLIYEESDSCWIDITDDWRYLRDGSFIWSSEVSGYRQLYHFSAAGKLIRKLTKGENEVSKVIGLAPDESEIYYLGKPDSPLEQQLFAVKIGGGEPLRLTQGAGFHQVQHPEHGDYFLDFFTTATRPEAISLLGLEGEEIAVIPLPNTKLEMLADLTYPEFVTIPAADGQTELNAMITKPANFERGKQYPVVIFGYGGPGSQVVLDRWGGKRFLFHQYLCQQGFICFSVDNRGTGGRGKAFKNLAYGDLGKYLLADQVAGVKYLRTLAYVDSSRIGIWGWSGGGYMTSLCLTAGSDYFQTGVAVAPVSDFRLYDTIWTERYMDLLTANPIGYEQASVLNYVDRFRGKLLLIHGTGDDNVHPMNSLQLADAMVKSGKMADMYFYANKNHSIPGRRSTYNVYRRIAEYFIDNLNP